LAVFSGIAPITCSCSRTRVFQLDGRLVLSQFRQKVNFAQCSIYNFSHVFWGGEGLVRRVRRNFPKICRKFRQNFGTISWCQNFKKNTTLATGPFHRLSNVLHTSVFITFFFFQWNFEVSFTFTAYQFIYPSFYIQIVLREQAYH